jgi:hypothetical protein
LIAGPAAGLASLGWIAKKHGRRSMILSASSIALVAWLAGWAVESIHPDLPSTAEHASSIEILSAVVLGVFVLRRIWLEGARRWIAGLIGR